MTSVLDFKILAGIPGSRKIKKERDKVRETQDRDRNRETEERMTVRQTGRDRARETERDRGRDIETEERENDKQSDRQAERERKKEMCQCNGAYRRGLLSSDRRLDWSLEKREKQN